MIDIRYKISDKCMNYIYHHFELKLQYPEFIKLKMTKCSLQANILKNLNSGICNAEHIYSQNPILLLNL